MTIFHIMIILLLIFIFFFFNDTATTEIYTLSLHDALPISKRKATWPLSLARRFPAQPLRRSSLSAQSCPARAATWHSAITRSEEHTSELQSQSNLVCRLLLEKKKKKIRYHRIHVTSLQLYY